MIETDVRVKKPSSFGGGLYIALTGLVRKGRYYSIKKIGNKIIIEDVQDII